MSCKLVLVIVLLVAAAFAVSITGQAQRGEYTFTGKVVDKSGRSLKHAQVWVSLKDESLVSPVETDHNGWFSLTRPAREGLSLSVFVIDERTYSQNRWQLPGPHGWGGTRKIKLGKDRTIDLGVMHVETTYVDVNLKLQSNGKPLTEKQWLDLWLNLRDSRGAFAVGSKIRPTLKEVDLMNSILKISLPEGRWRIEIQRYDAPGKLVRPNLGRTPYFEINRQNTGRIITVPIRSL